MSAGATDGYAGTGKSRAWLLSRVPGPNGGYQRNLLSALSRWKLMDNLRRSILPVALVLLVLLGWIVLAEPAYWTSVLIFVLATPGRDRGRFRALGKAAGGPLATASCHLLARRKTELWPSDIHVGLPSVRSLFQSRCNMADPCAPVHHAAPVAGVESLARGRARVRISSG